MTKDPQIIITVDDVSAGRNPKEPYKVTVELESLKKLSLSWIILPVFYLSLDIDLRNIPEDILPILLDILRAFGHVYRFGYILHKSDKYGVIEDLSRPTSVKRVLEFLQRLKYELSQEASTIDGFLPQEIVPHAINFIDHIFKWYEHWRNRYYTGSAFEKTLDETHSLELKRLEKFLSDWWNTTGKKNKTVRRSPRLTIKGAKPRGILKLKNTSSKPSKK